MGVAFSSTSEYTKEAANSISDLNPNAADILISTAVSYTHLTLPTNREV